MMMEQKLMYMVSLAILLAGLVVSPISAIGMYADRCSSKVMLTISLCILIVGICDNTIGRISPFVLKVGPHCNIGFKNTA